MTKKNLKPQQAAPVQRDNTSSSAEGGTGLITPLDYDIVFPDGGKDPFAGDDAE